MSTLDFSSWIREGGDIFNGDAVPTQTASSTVNTMAGGSTSRTIPRTQKPTVYSIDIGTVDTGVADNSVVQSQVSYPTIFDPFMHDEVPETKIADEYMDIFTPSINLTDIFSTNMNPQ